MWLKQACSATDTSQNTEILHVASLTLYLIETPFNTFANRADPDQAALPDQGLLCLLMEYD